MCLSLMICYSVIVVVTLDLFCRALEFEEKRNSGWMIYLNIYIYYFVATFSLSRFTDKRHWDIKE